MVICVDVVPSSGNVINTGPTSNFSQPSGSGITSQSTTSTRLSSISRKTTSALVISRTSAPAEIDGALRNPRLADEIPAPPEKESEICDPGPTPSLHPVRSAAALINERMVRFMPKLPFSDVCWRIFTFSGTV